MVRQWSFSLQRLLLLVTAAAFLALAYARLSWPLAFLITGTLAGAIGVAASFKGKRLTANSGLAAFFLTVGMVYFTDWGLSRPSGEVRIAWIPLILAIVAKLLTATSLLICHRNAETKKA